MSAFVVKIMRERKNIQYSTVGLVPYGVGVWFLFCFFGNISINRNKEDLALFTQYIAN